ncbi:MAG: DUF616 domain-containing protein [Eubacterium sp.]|nr:DUF616 domain-containing protein [Eubacterium sp.]
MSGQYRNTIRLCKEKLFRILRHGKKKEMTVSNYFSEERIAVYTVIFGKYDVLYEPKCCPDNCDFFVISDTVEPPSGSAWKKLILPEEMLKKLDGMNAIRKNRYVKMLPHLFFSDYNFSVYLDGNIALVTDPTEFINRMPDVGASFHKHVSRDCVYDEARAILDQNKAPKIYIYDLIAFLKKENMPSHYGLLECPVIVRNHNQSECIEIMEAWWELFEKYPYRDQMLLPYVLFKRGIRPDELACLGNNVRFCSSFRRYQHII